MRTLSIDCDRGIIECFMRLSHISFGFKGIVISPLTTVGSVNRKILKLRLCLESFLQGALMSYMS